MCSSELSAFEPAAVIEALAEIAASPQVWKIDGDKYEEVDRSESVV